MLKQTICFSIILSLFLAPDNVAKGQDATGPENGTVVPNSFADILKNEASSLSDSSINEILEIRKRLGGGTGIGISDLFKPTSIRKTRKKSTLKANVSSILDDKKPVPSLAVSDSERIFFEMLQSSPPVHVGRTDPGYHRNNRTQSAPEDQVLGESEVKSQGKTARDAARRIEQLAADLEDSELFAGADRLRQVAADLRQQVRKTSKTAQKTRRIR